MWNIRQHLKQKLVFREQIWISLVYIYTWGIQRLYDVSPLYELKENKQIWSTKQQIFATKNNHTSRKKTAWQTSGEPWTLKLLFQNQKLSYWTTKVENQWLKLVYYWASCRRFTRRGHESYYTVVTAGHLSESIQVFSVFVLQLWSNLLTLNSTTVQTLRPDHVQLHSKAPGRITSQV